MTTLMETRFEEWTLGLARRPALISVFEHIRDIPYSLNVPPADPVEAQELILSYGRGSCGPKHRLLAWMARRLGYEVAYARISFLWKDLGACYPLDLTRLAEDLPVAHHLACRISVDDRWVLVDATWDLPLGKAGFPVNEKWDGVSDTRCAVRHLPSGSMDPPDRSDTDRPGDSRQKPGASQVSGRREQGSTGGSIPGRPGLNVGVSLEDIDRIRRFYRDFDAWLIRIRTC